MTLEYSTEPGDEMDEWVMLPTSPLSKCQSVRDSGWMESVCGECFAHCPSGWQMLSGVIFFDKC